jgi:ubiquinone/menaquinone biosynthesis C-methylase UbiE
MDTKKYFEKVAKKWDKMREAFFTEKVREKAIAIANVRPGKLAADIGAGTGFMTEELIEKGLKIIAIDQSEAMLEEMKKKFASINGIDYRIGKAENLPVLNEFVDYVFANMLLHHVNSPPKVIKEMVRILKPGGKLIITDLDKHNFEFLREEHYDKWMGFEREDIKEWLKKARLKNVIIDCVGEKCCCKSNFGDEYASISIFIALGEK